MSIYLYKASTPIKKGTLDAKSECAPGSSSAYRAACAPSPVNVHLISSTSVFL